MYSIDMDVIASVNHIQNSASIESGQELFIPNARKTQAPINVRSEEFIWPLKGKITCYFGQTSNDMLNKGINIQPSGNFNVCASRSGKVVFLSESFGLYGKTVIIEHADGLSSVYSGDLKLLLKVGDNIQKGDLLAKDDGSLHFEIRKGYQAQNPLFYLP
jgi:murein DD-endopeptidase MepM/ murein hydrolase activator NlpD